MDPTRADVLFASLSRKAVVTGGGAARSYKITWEKLGKRAYPAPA